MARMKAAQITKPGAPFEIVERDIPQPGPGKVRIKVEACGICHSDTFVKDGQWPGLEHPRVPGHEVAGRVDAVGEGVLLWKPGQRVGVGWHGGHCFRCDPCRRGDFILCVNGKVTGFHFDGGFAEYMIAPEEAIAAMPDDLAFDEAAPLMCAGITLFNSLRHAGATGGDTVAIQGIGGLGHLGVQYAQRMGFRTVAIGRGEDKEGLAKKLGAWQYIDAGAGDVAEQLKKIGGAKVIIATAPDPKAMSSLVGGLAPNGKLVVIAPAGEIPANTVSLIMLRQSIQGWPSGTGMDSQDTLKFSVLSGVRPMIEKFPLSRVAEAYDRALSGKARFRVVLTIGAGN